MPATPPSTSNPTTTGWLSKLEDAYITSPLRRWHQALDLARLTRAIPLPTGSHVLDIGCGTGVGLMLLHQRTHPATLTGVDPNPQQIARTRAHLTRQHIPAQLHVAGAEQLPLPAATYDAVTSFGCMHHVANWPKAVAEAARVLRHGGLLYLNEYYAPLLEQPLFAKLCPHPPQRFTHQQLLNELPKHGFQILHHTSRWQGRSGDVIARLTRPPSYD